MRLARHPKSGIDIVPRWTSRRCRWRTRGEAGILLTLAGFGLFTVAPARAVEIPQYAPAQHLGVGACASPQCHGKIAPGAARSPLLNEYVTWSRRDRHARAFATLRSERSRRIAANLGLQEAHTASLCLDCHADNVPPPQQGRSFQIADGVGCESCHGGAEQWIESHANGASHGDNVSRGLYRSDEPEARAQLCLSCHLGSDRKPLTHRLLAAGHPRTAFELDTWTQLQPAHFVVDAHYRERKSAPAPAAVWAMGQAVALHAYVAALADPKRVGEGTWPEFALYDCYGCHHAFGAEPPSAARVFGLRPGLPRLEEFRFLTVKAILSAIEPARAAHLEASLRELNSAGAQGSGSGIAGGIAADVTDTYDSIRNWDPTPAQLDIVLAALTAAGRAGDYHTYAAAEQLTMAVQAILATLNDGKTRNPVRSRLQVALDAMFAATRDEHRFDPVAFRKAVERLRARY